jgi:hypothetical protein
MSPLRSHANPTRGTRLGRLGAALLAAACLGLTVLPAAAETSWRSLDTERDAGGVCLDIRGQEFGYTLLDDEEPAQLELRGPRRLKIIARYLFSPDDPDTRSYTIRVLMDGREVLRKLLTANLLPELRLCDDEAGQVSALRRVYLDVPSGLHDIQVFAETPTEGRVAARFFRETRKKSSKDVAYAPERYHTIYHLQFASGKQSTYYHFDVDQPLVFSVKGPTNLKVYTRLDFNHTMNGDQAYSLELLRDGESTNVYHYHASKLSAAAYVERGDILPGDRKLMRIAVPKGIHHYEVRCVRPENCGIAAQIRIPEADVKPR